MTSPRSSYGGGYYSAPFPDTPIYDNLVAERGTPQIAPIRVPAAYDSGSHLPALPALPSGSSHHNPAHSYGGNGQQHYAPAPHIPQQASPRGYPGQQYQHNPGASTGYEAMRPAAPRPAARPAPAPYDDPYGRQHPARGY